jgi:hypothetical protein
LQDAGVEFGLNNIVETLSNSVGGTTQSTAYQDLLGASLALDL